MSVVGCPRCDESFRVPDSPLPGGLRLRCPWCTEVFDVSELSHRMPPMVELIGEDGQTLDIESVAMPPQVANAASGGMLLQQTANRIEPGEPDGESLRFIDDSSPASSPSTSKTISNAETIIIDDDELQAEPPTRIFDSDEFDEVPANEAVALESNDQHDDVDQDDYVNESDYVEEGDDFDPEYDPEYDPDYDPEYDPDYPETMEYEEDYDDQNELEEVEADSRTPVEGPVPPKPLSKTVSHDFSNSTVAARPRKKSGSPIKSIIGVVLGGLMSVPLAGGLLTLMGKKPDWGFYPFDGSESNAAVVAGNAMTRPGDGSFRPRSSNTDPSDALPPNAFGGQAPDDVDELPASDVPESVPETATDPTIGQIPTAESLDSLMSDPSTEQPDPIEALQGEIISEPVLSNLEPMSEPASEGAEALIPANNESAAATDELNDMVSGNEKPADAPVSEVAPTAPPVSFPPIATPELVNAIQGARKSIQTVSELAQSGTAAELKQEKALLYTAIAKIALAPQAIDQPETKSILDEVSSAGLATEMLAVAPNWLRYSKRPHDGLFAVGEIVRENDDWLMKCDGIKGTTTVQLRDFVPGEFNAGDKVIVLGKILDSSPPAIIQITYAEKR